MNDTVEQPQEQTHQPPAATQAAPMPQEKIMAAFIEAQGDMDSVLKTRKAQHGKIANIDDIIIAIRPTLREHSLGFTFNLHTTEHYITFRLTLMHSSGQSMRWDDFSMPLTKLGAQDVGSLITYGKRYQLAAAFGIPLEDEHDDDGGRAQQSNRPKNRGSQNLAQRVVGEHDDTLGNAATDIKRQVKELGLKADDLRNAMKRDKSLPVNIINGPPEDWPRDWGERVAKWLKQKQTAKAKEAEKKPEPSGDEE